MEAVPVAGRGSLNFIERLMQLATTEFIRQCRYNPQHNAESEQHLYDLLEQQLMQGGGSMTLEIKSAEQVHSAKISQASLLQALGEDYQAIDKHLQALVRGYSAGTAQPRLLLSPALAVLPGLTASLSHEAEVLDEAALHRNCAALASLFPKVADSGSSGNNSETARAFNLITEVPHGG